MTSAFTYFPAHAVRPCVMPHGDGVIFSAVFQGPGERGLQLIHLSDGEAVFIPLTEEYRIGRVYSVQISPFRADEWMYRYKNKGVWTADPCAMGIGRVCVRTDGGMEETVACIWTPFKNSSFPGDSPERPLPFVEWKDQLIYALHVRGFTGGQPDDFPGRGTFLGVIHMIPYLQRLGVTAVELMPVYLPLPDLRKTMTFRTMQEALGAWPVGPQGDPIRDMKDRPNYWGFGRGLYRAIRPEYGSPEDFALMVRCLHKAGIRVLLQMDFEKSLSPADRINHLYFYVEQFGVDGFRLVGSAPSAAAIASAPALSDTAFLSASFPFEDLEEAEEDRSLLTSQDIESLFPCGREAGTPSHSGMGDWEDDLGPGAVRIEEKSLISPLPAARLAGAGQSPKAASFHKPTFPGLIDCGEEFQTLLRRFVKSDDYVMRDFLRLFLGVSENHGVLRTVTGHEGFTLADLVSYNERHNEANGEFGLDGREDNYSWNCGEEGPSNDPQVLALRARQRRNFMALLLLAQGTPMLLQGDERLNSQGGNNNPYCQDNTISWVDWENSRDRRIFNDYTARLAAFRRDHPVFRSRRAFQYMDYAGLGFPDVSLHGAEAWKPDLGPVSHSIGISYCETYTEDPARYKARTGKKPAPSLLYLAVNMYWEELSLALPKLPPHYVWKVVLDTETEEGFLTMPVAPPDQHQIFVGPRSLKLLRSVYDAESVCRERTGERLKKLPPVSSVVRALRRKGNASGKRLHAPTLRLMKTMIRPSVR